MLPPSFVWDSSSSFQICINHSLEVQFGRFYSFFPGIQDSCMENFHPNSRTDCLEWQIHFIIKI